MIKINLVREGRAVRGGGAAPTAAGISSAPANINNILLLGFLVLGVLAAAGYWLWTRGELTRKQGEVAQRQEIAAKLESIIKEVDDYQKRKDNLQKRIDLINELKKNQKGPVRIMDQISRNLPDLVWLDQMSINEGRVAVTGRGLNPNAIANFIENIKNDPYFEEPEVGEVSQVSAAPLVYSFNMEFAFAYTPKGAADGSAATDTAATTTTTTTTTGTTTAPTP
ncbi:MAG TPA: PilN domain-containing protein [Thermoanaerobaculia bacterium]